MLQDDAARLVQSQLRAVHEAVGFSSQQALQVAASNRRMLAELGFGHSTLAADLQDDDDEEEEEEALVSPATGAARGASFLSLASFHQPEALHMYHWY